MTMQSKETSDTSIPGARMTRRGLLVGAAALGLSVLEVDVLGGVVNAATPQTARTQANGTVYVEIDAGHNQEPIAKYTPAMQKKFGITVKQVALPFVGQYEKLVTELISRSGAYDVMFFPPYFLGDFVAKKFVLPLESYAAK
ncbi:MAG TPA: hypothetical protein VJY65_02845, partial [Chloroflexota bacterium]|nr:hypothetical protein [Chloroflexota bacterium]